MVSGKSYNMIGMKLKDLKVKEEMMTIRKMVLEGSTHKCSDCPICHRVYSDQEYHSCDCDYYKYTYNNYDWDTLKESLIHEGYTPTKYKDGYITVIENMVVDGSHRVILLNEIYGSDYIVNVKVITPKSDAMYTNNVKS